MGKSDGGFEYNLRDKLNEYREENPKVKEIGFWAKRIPQSKYNKQWIDIILSCRTSDYHMAFECKSKKVKNKTSKIHFSSHFREEQIPVIQKYIDRTKRDMYLAISFRRGRGKKRLSYIIEWYKFMEWWNDEDVNGITPKMMEENGYEITEGAINFLNSQ